MNIQLGIPLHRYFPRNTQGRDLFVGDIHGNYPLFIHALKVLHFDKYHDRIFSAGDLTDRGVDSFRTLQLARERWFIPVLGNHESFIMERYDEDAYKQCLWVINGGEWWLSLSDEERDFARETVSSCYSLTLTVEVGELLVGLLHAEYPFCTWPVDEELVDDESQQKMLWGRDDILRGSSHHIGNVDMVVCGHTPLDGPKMKRNKLFIDTGAAYSASSFIPDPRITLCEFHSGIIITHSFNMHDEKRAEFTLL